MTCITPATLNALRNVLSPHASVNLPGDPEYFLGRWAKNAERPAAIVACPATEADVVQFIKFAQGTHPYGTQGKLHLAVKGGGHTPSGASSSDGGIVVDLQPHMHNVRVDPKAKLAYVQGGCIWKDVDEATFPYGLVSVAGVVNHTGVGGFVYFYVFRLGGGFGWLCGQHGLVIDNLVQATMVTSAGEILTANESNHPDLFWALRGGGGNFGVVTEFVLKLHEQRPDLYSSALIFAPPMIERLVTEINAWLPGRAPSETAHIVFALGPNGQASPNHFLAKLGPCLILQLMYNGSSEEGIQKFQRFTNLGPVINQSETIPYLKLNTLQNASAQHGDYRLLQGNFIPIRPEGIPPQLILNSFNAWLKFVTENPPAARSINVIELYHHAKWSSVAPNATAYAQRNPTYNIEYLLHWSDPTFTDNATKALADMDSTFIKSRDELIGRGATGQGGYTNYLDEESKTADTAWLRRRFGDNYSRLIEVKQKYDPNNLFGRWFIERKQV